MQGLNGFLGRFLKKAIEKVAGLVDSYLNVQTLGISSSIGSFSAWAEEIGSGDATFWNRTEYNGISLGSLENDPRGQYEPTLDEEKILDSTLNEIALVITSITEEAVLIENSRLSIQKINQLLQRIAVLKAHFFYSETHGLSLKAINLRDLIIDVMVLPSLKVVETKISSVNNLSIKKITKTIEAGTIATELNPLIHISWKKYFASFDTYSLPDRIDFLQLENVSDVLPIDEQPIETEPTEPDAVATTTQQSKTTGLKWILFALAGFGIYKAVTKK